MDLESLSERVRLLEAQVGAPGGEHTRNILDELENLRSLLGGYEQNKVFTVLDSCGFHVESTLASSIEDGDRMQVEILSSWTRYNSCISQVECIVSEYTDIFARFAEKCSLIGEAGGQNEKQYCLDDAAILKRYNQMLRKFEYSIQRLIALLEQYSLVRYEQGETVASIKSINSTSNQEQGNTTRKKTKGTPDVQEPITPDPSIKSS